MITMNQSLIQREAQNLLACSGSRKLAAIVCQERNDDDEEG
jgi:hypothetical protein